ncbi:phosphoribosyltransferase [Aquihabitans daechungensis]|uniref:phosphoribosyltransferase n=1 Tax=Aquihabitans daechungensis TaxID=1052257 RepID=UPI003BA0DB06
MPAQPAAEPELLAGPEDLDRHARALAAAISADHPRGVTLVGVLKGSVIFLSDLARHVTVPTRLELLAVAPYDGAAGRTRVVKDLDASVEGEDVVLVTGIVDTGLTADFLLRHLADGGPASLGVCALADKRARRILPLTIDYVAIDAPDAFLLGYGLDYAGRYRNLRGLWTADGAALADDPDRYVAQLHLANR